ncbi:MAG TPA: aerial mycelium formation protein [Mycobacteriales bacterium]|nr:aerial mycelium formation protein [Mycobacteriales bacterium]
MTVPTRNRRIDRLLAADYLAELSSRSTDEIRAMRAEAEQEETDLSFLRRLLQGRIDILRAEQARRHGDGPEGSLVESLAGILADDRVPSHGLGRHAVLEPSDVAMYRRYVEALVFEANLSDPAALDDALLNRLLAVLDREEAEVSRKRRSMQLVMDALTAELGRRYREGVADVADLLHTEGE